MTHKIAERFSKLIQRMGGIEAIVVFGSATRDQDFVEGLSDIDVLVILSRKDEKLKEKIQSIAGRFPRLSPAIMSRGEFLRKLKKGDPGVLLMCRGSVVYDSGFFQQSKTKVHITEFTHKRLLELAVCALELSTRNLFLDNLEEALSSAYHAARHALRAEILAKKHFLADSNQEILNSLSAKERRKFKEFLDARKNYRNLSLEKVEDLNRLARKIIKRVMKSSRFCYYSNSKNEEP